MKAFRDRQLLPDGGRFGQPVLFIGSPCHCGRDDQHDGAGRQRGLDLAVQCARHGRGGRVMPQVVQGAPRQYHQAMGRGAANPPREVAPGQAVHHAGAGNGMVRDGEREPRPLGVAGEAARDVAGSGGVVPPRSRRTTHHEHGNPGPGSRTARGGQRQGCDPERRSRSRREPPAHAPGRDLCTCHGGSVARIGLGDTRRSESMHGGQCQHQGASGDHSDQRG